MGTVCCKIPSGLFAEWYKDPVKQNDGTIESERVSIKFEGGASTSAKLANDGYGRTHNVSKDLWDEFFDKVGKYLPAVTNGLIFFQSDENRAADKVKENNKGKKVSGLERLQRDDIDPEALAFAQEAA